jgi:hypothetical protein
LGLHADTPKRLFTLPAFARNFPAIGMAKTFGQAVLAGTLIDFSNYFSPREMSWFASRE